MEANGAKPVAAAQTEDLSVHSRIISDSVQTHQNRLTDIGLPQRDLQTSFPEIVKDNAAQNAKFEILRACEKAVAIVQGPVEWMMHQNMALLSRLALALRLRWAWDEHIASGEDSTSLDELVERTGVSRDIILRMLRVCTQRLYFE